MILERHAGSLPYGPCFAFSYIWRAKAHNVSVPNARLGRQLAVSAWEAGTLWGHWACNISLLMCPVTGPFIIWTETSGTRITEFQGFCRRISVTRVSEFPGSGSGAVSVVKQMSISGILFSLTKVNWLLTAAGCYWQVVFGECWWL